MRLGRLSVVAAVSTLWAGNAGAERPAALPAELIESVRGRYGQD